MCYEAVIRNDDGYVMVMRVDHCFSDDVDIAEVESLRFSMQFTNETSLSLLVVKSDSLRFIQFVSDTCHTCTELF